MANEVFFDTSGFFALIDEHDRLHQDAVQWTRHLAAKAMIRRQADQGYSFVDCISFCLMKERKIKEAFTTDTHFRKAGFSAVLT